MVSPMGGSSMERDIEVCLSSEQTARQQLVKDWDTYSAQDRGRCIRRTSTYRVTSSGSPASIWSATSGR